MSAGGESSRYDRQIRLRNIGQSGQQRLFAATVAVLGCGALGTVVADILARAGLGSLRLIDRDVVEWTNLQRQSLFCEEDARSGRAKADAACLAILRANSSVRCDPIVSDVTPDNIAGLLGGCDLVVDAVDNFATRMLLNDFSLAHGLPWVHGGCVGTVGQVAFFSGRGRPCFRCLVPTVPPSSVVETCDTAGVLGSATHAIASLQATVALKYLTGNETAIASGVLSLDFWNNRYRTIEISDSLSDACIACVERRFDFLEGTSAGVASVICGRNAVQLNPDKGIQIDLPKIAFKWELLGETESNRFFVRLRISESETLTVFRDGRVIVEGTDQISRARSLVSQLLGG